jgi:integrase
MLSAAAEEAVLPHNPVLLLESQQRRGRARKLARSTAPRGAIAIDPVAWFLVLEYLRRPTRPGGRGRQERVRRYPLDRERDALIVALGFMAGLRLPSEALGLTRDDVRNGRLHVEGRSSQGEYLAGSKTGPGRDLPLVPALADELKRVRRAYRDAGQGLQGRDFWIGARRGGIWSENQAHAWREREFRPVARQIARDFQQFSALAKATPYLSRHTFVSCCLQAGISLATIASWCGTSIQMISRTYGRMIRRYEGIPPLELAEQYRTAKVEAMFLLSARSRGSKRRPQGGSTAEVLEPAVGKGGSKGGSTAVKLPVSRRQRID